MKSVIKQNGFSLTEVLMAAGILCIGIMLVATMFPAAIYLTTVASERTMAAIVADEAFAKIQLYGIKDPYKNPNMCFDYNSVFNLAPGQSTNLIDKIDPNESSYPSVDPCSTNRQYYWSALVRKLDSDSNSTNYLVTVFVARKTSPSLRYPRYGLGFSSPTLSGQIGAVIQTDPNKIEVQGTSLQQVFPPSVIVDNATGRLYRIIDKNNNIVTLDRRWDKDTANPAYIWFMSPPATGTPLKVSGKNPDIEVFQRIIRF